jgi:putative transposase
LAASTIAAIYKDRWKIELFFKAHQAEFKTEVISEEAEWIQTQIWLH